MLSSSIPLSVRIESQMKLAKQVFIACCSFFWHHSENWDLKTVSFHFQSFKCTLTLQWCETLALKIEYTGRRGGHLWKYSCSCGNGFWLVYEDLSIQDRDLACKIGLRSLLEPAIISSYPYAAWWVNFWEGLAGLPNDFFRAWHG